MLSSKSIGNKIAIARKRLNLSQTEIAQQISISSQAVGKWERGESLPDIIMLTHLAEILGVDLNYFSENLSTATAYDINQEIKKSESTKDTPEIFQKKKPAWDLSRLNLIDSDFSGLNNLHETLGSANIQRCLFVGSELSGLSLNNNFVDNCDFSGSDISAGNVQNSMLAKNKFTNCSLRSTKFSRSFIEACDFTGADFTGTEFKTGGFGKSVIANTKLQGTIFNEMSIQNIVFEGILEDCRFENCTFYAVKFQNASFINTFFKNNKKFKRVKFINCSADKLTFAFLKNNMADMTGVSLLSR
ncbi:MAG: helix-turn-helix domain-containing protein [Bacteroidales bacterium]